MARPLTSSTRLLQSILNAPFLLAEPQARPRIRLVRPVSTSSQRCSDGSPGATRRADRSGKTTTSRSRSVQATTTRSGEPAESRHARSGSRICGSSNRHAARRTAETFTTAGMNAPAGRYESPGLVKRSSDGGRSRGPARRTPNKVTVTAPRWGKAAALKHPGLRHRQEHRRSEEIPAITDESMGSTNQRQEFNTAPPQDLKAGGPKMKILNSDGRRLLRRALEFDAEKAKKLSADEVKKFTPRSVADLTAEAVAKGLVYQEIDVWKENFKLRQKKRMQSDPTLQRRTFGGRHERDDTVSLGRVDVTARPRRFPNTATYAASSTPPDGAPRTIPRSSPRFSPSSSPESSSRESSRSLRRNSPPSAMHMAPSKFPRTFPPASARAPADIWPRISPRTTIDAGPSTSPNRTSRTASRNSRPSSASTARSSIPSTSPKTSPRASTRTSVRTSPGTTPADEPGTPAESEEPPRVIERWRAHAAAMKAKFPNGWNPRKKLSPDTMQGIKQLHLSDPDAYTTPILAQQFRTSPEAVRRILRSKWIEKLTPEQMVKKRGAWARRHDAIWDQQAELGLRPQRIKERKVLDASEGADEFEFGQWREETLAEARGA